MKKLLLIVSILLLANSLVSTAQAKESDSLHKLINNHTKRDTTRFRLIHSYITSAVNVNTSEIQSYVNEMIEISKATNYNRGLQIAYSMQEIYYADRGDFPNAFLYADSAFMAFKDDTSKAATQDKAFLHHNVGIDCYKIGDYRKAIEHYTQAANLLEQINPKIVSVVYDGMAEVYHNMTQYDKATEYDKKAIAAAKKFRFKSAIASRTMNYITRLLDRNMFVEAEEELSNIEPIVKEVNKPISSLLFYQCKGKIFQEKKQFQEAVDYLKLANTYAKISEDQNLQLATLGPLIECLIEAGKLDDAKVYLDTLLQNSIKYEMKTYRTDAYSMLAQWHIAKSDYKTAYRFLEMKMLLSDSISSDEAKEKIAQAEIRYKVAGKDREIKSLQDEKQIQQLLLHQKNILNYILIGSALSLLVISLLGYRNYTHRQKLQQAKIDELETEKQLTATEAILKGEEQERSRLAKDLHDGLGGMLSGIKYSLNNMKENLIMTPTNAQAFEHSINMLDNSINEMRRVAHNLMPESLLKFGLDDALKDFCNEINRNGILKVIYQSFDLKDKSIDQSLSVTIYRVIQELLNNIVKHAEAKQAIVQVSVVDNQITLTVEDDGKGFDSLSLPTVQGIGWKNITSRVDYHKGKINLQSEAGKGTSIFIEFPTA